jgi:hypothetical protein
MGGSAGRADAMVGAVEAQKAEGVLHVHFFLYLQTACQFNNLKELGDMIRKAMLSVKAFKEYVSYVRCAEYPDVGRYEAERPVVEKAWPAYQKDATLSRLPACFWNACSSECKPAAWEAMYKERLQHTLSHFNHHVHPLINEVTGERRVLSSCRPKTKENTCKSGFPLTTHLTEKPLFMCECLAISRALPVRGPRSIVGGVLSACNSDMLNPGPRAWVAFAADNGDIQFPYRLPVMPETQ